MTNSQFKIEQKINESATTVVYRAFDQVLHRTVLLKVLHKHLANDPDLKQRFTREARACAALHSEHIVQIFDLTEIDGAPAIVMEFVEGKSLKDAIASGSVGSLEGTRKVAVHVLRALAIAHERGIIHRDIKPGNILVSENGTVKVTDFGLAYVALSPTVTMEGMVLGTPAYMAPEQVRGDDIDQRTDLFALGVTLVETLTGERIFEGSTYTECMKKVLAFKVQELDRFGAHSTPEFTEFLKKLLHPAKQDRFASSREALNFLGDTISGVSKELLPKKRKNPIPMVIAGMIAAAAAVFGWMNLSPTRITESPMEVARQADSAHIVRNSVSDQPNSPLKEPSAPETAHRTEKIIGKTPVQAVQDSGKLFLTSSPWAKVYVDNRLIGETPIAKPLILSAGEHTVMFAHPSFDPIVTTVTIEPGKDKSASGNFIDNAGYLMCVVSPWAEVYIDEQYKDTTPLSKPMVLSSGKHTVRLKNASFTDVIKEIVVNPKDTVMITHVFRR